jgi:hypothetical protein
LRLIPAFKRLRSDERGTVEAGMALIPTTAFFLLVMQLVISGSFQVIETIDLQNVATRSALADSGKVDFVFDNERRTGSESLQLPGGGELLLVSSQVKSPRVTQFANSANMRAQALVIRE